MCMYCEKPKTEDEHFACEICDEGMCGECYDLDVEHGLHYNRPLECCDNKREIKLITKACGGEPEYLCEKCLSKILANPFDGMSISDIIKFIDNKLPDGEEVYLFSSEEYLLEFDKDEWEEVEGNPILWKTCLMDDDGGINRETISEAFLSDREALVSFYDNTVEFRQNLSKEDETYSVYAISDYGSTENIESGLTLAQAREMKDKLTQQLKDGVFVNTTSSLSVVTEFDFDEL